MEESCLKAEWGGCHSVRNFSVYRFPSAFFVVPAGQQRHEIKAGVWVNVYSRLGVSFVYYRITALGGNGSKAEIETLCVLLFYLLRLFS